MNVHEKEFALLSSVFPQQEKMYKHDLVNNLREVSQESDNSSGEISQEISQESDNSSGEIDQFVRLLDSNREIERKFLVRKLPSIDDGTITFIEQGYVCLGDNEEVRLRKSHLYGSYFVHHRLAVKKGTGMSREEYEINLNCLLFNHLWPTTEGRRLRKKRYGCNFPDRQIDGDGRSPPLLSSALRPKVGPATSVQQNRFVEIDVYEGHLEALIVAEVEFTSEEEANSFEPYPWMGREVTNDSDYKNRSLAIRTTLPSLV